MRHNQQKYLYPRFHQQLSLLARKNSSLNLPIECGQHGKRKFDGSFPLQHSFHLQPHDAAVRSADLEYDTSHFDVVFVRDYMQYCDDSVHDTVVEEGTEDGEMDIVDKCVLLVDSVRCVELEPVYEAVHKAGV